MNSSDTPSMASPLNHEMVIGRFFAGVYTWMMAALALTSAVAWFASGFQPFVRFITVSQYGYIGLIVAQLGLVLVLASMVHRMSRPVAVAVFLLYAGLTGLTFSSIFLAYTTASIFKAFGTAALMFGAMSAYGYTTKKDLSAWGGFLFMSLIGIVAGSIINLWLASPMVEWMVTYGGVVVFAGLAAYDHQKLKEYALHDVDGSQNLVVRGALTLYLDFINLFLSLLRIFGSRD